MGEAEELTARFDSLRRDLSNARTFLVLAGLEDEWTTHPLIEHQLNLLLPPCTPLRVPYERLMAFASQRILTAPFSVAAPSLLAPVFRAIALTNPLWWCRLWNADTRAQFNGYVPLALTAFHDLIVTVEIASFLEGILVGDILFDAPALLAWREETLQQAENSMLPGLPRNT